MKNSILIILLLSLFCCTKTIEKHNYTWKVEELVALPEPVTNNAVVEGFNDRKPFVYSFAGLDSTKAFSGIHLRSYKYDFLSKTWQQIADLPDTLGKIASAVSRVKDTIYIIGGYHVFEDHSEKSSNKVHRYDIINDQYLQDGKAIPVPIDDQVQAVWRDSLIYVVTGWSDKENVPNVQIYNPYHDDWSIGTPVPNNHIYKSFGAAGTIIGDTIYYYGGASMGKHYPIQNVIRKGVINSKDPTKIQWSHKILDSTVVGYRMGATSTKGLPYWFGGSKVTYNYNPIAYNGSGPVNPANRSISIQKDSLSEDFSNKFPMDLRGIASLNDSTKIIVGGIGENQKVSDKTYLLKHRKEK